MRKQGPSTTSPKFVLDGLNLERNSATSIARQLYEQLRTLIISGALPSGANLPSSRQLAIDLGISRNTVTAAFSQLETENYLEILDRSRTIVADISNKAASNVLAGGDVPSLSLSHRGQIMSRMTYNWSLPGRPSFLPGASDVREFPFSVWRRLIARRMRPGGEDVFGYHHTTGYPPLKEAIKLHLETSRGVRCEPQQIIITGGAQAAFDLLARILLDPGDTVWVEEPGYPGAQDAFQGAGASLLPLRVDEGGWNLEFPSNRKPRLIYVTPSCQSPFGLTMSLRQRLELIELANQHDAWIIEDDYDGEYRFSGPPVSALQGIDTTGRTIYVGTFSKTIFPALRIGFMIVPLQLADVIKRAMFLTGQPTSLLIQSAFSDFITEGHYTTHLGRMRRIYTSRREQFQSRCASILGQWSVPVPSDFGLQQLWLLKDRYSDLEIATAAREQLITVTPLTSYYMHGRSRSGLIFGYTGLEERAMERELLKLKQLFEKFDA